MIQRQQTLWLLLTAVAGFFSFQYPFYSGYMQTEGTAPYFSDLTPGSNPFILLLTIAVVAIAGITIFLFKNRKLQLRLTIAGILVSLGLLTLYFTQTKEYVAGQGNLALTSVLVFVIPVGFVMAARGIWKDQKLVKSLDKLR